MEFKDVLAVITAIFSVFAVVISAYVAFRSLKPKMLLDGSQAAENFQAVAVKLQAEVKELREMVEGKQLRVNLDIVVQIDKKPEVEINGFEWVSIGDSQIKTKPLPPKKGIFR